MGKQARIERQDAFLNLPVPRAVAKFAVPTILSQMVTLLYNLADTFFVGHTNDPAQVAALTLSFPLFMSLTMVGNLFGIGANSFISRSLGQGARETASKASTFAFYGAIGGVLVIIAVLGTFMAPILRTIGAITPESFTATKAYLTWTVLYGGVPTVASLMLGHLVRAEGNTKQASIGMALGGVLNIGLDYVFVPVLGLGAEGAAIATFISNIIAFLYLLQVILRNRESVIVLSPAKLRFEVPIMKQVILVGIPAAAIIVLGSSANIVLTHFMSAYGDVSIAVFCILFVELCAGTLINLFINELATVEKGVEFLRIWFLCAPGMCFTNLFSSVFQSMGKWVHSLALSVIRQAGFLFPLLVILNLTLGEIGLICAQPIADTGALLLGIGIYRRLVRKLKDD